MSDKSAATGWAGLSLAGQFALAGSLVILAAALAVGGLVAERIERVVVHNTASANALYMESFVGALTQNLTQHDSLASRSKKGLSELLALSRVGKTVVSFKVWRPGGLVIDASDPEQIGKTFPIAENLAGAFAGSVTAEFEQHRDEEDAAEGALDLPLLEIYTPIRNPANGEVIAVVEFYLIAEDLKRDIFRARLQTWALVVGILSLIFAALFLIVLRGSRTIDAQLVALTEMSGRNVALRVQIQNAAERAATLSERTLRQIGADLHDGPAQLMAFAALRLDALASRQDGEAGRAVLDEVRGAVNEAITEIRNLSRGMSVPDLDRRDMGEVLRDLAEAHAARSGTKVEFATPDPGALGALPAALRLCLYRFVQEGLTNSWRHAGGLGQELRIERQGARLRVSVLDRGPGFAATGAAGEGAGAERLGLDGLRDRVEALGGRLECLDRAPFGTGAELRMTIEVRE